MEVNIDFICFFFLRYDQIWDPQQINNGYLHGKMVGAFINEGSELNEKIARMETIHKNNYNVEASKTELANMTKRSKDIPITLTPEEVRKLHDSDAFNQKKISLAASQIGRSVSACLVHYYNWKQTAEYIKFKERLSADADYCTICNDGGELLVCDNCRSAFHLKCLI